MAGAGRDAAGSRPQVAIPDRACRDGAYSHIHLMLKSPRHEGVAFVDDCIDLTGAIWKGCSFDGCILGAACRQPPDHHRELHAGTVQTGGCRLAARPSPPGRLAGDFTPVATAPQSPDNVEKVGLSRSVPMDSDARISSQIVYRRARRVAIFGSRYVRAHPPREKAKAPERPRPPAPLFCPAPDSVRLPGRHRPWRSAASCVMLKECASSRPFSQAEGGGVAALTSRPISTRPRRPPAMAAAATPRIETPWALNAQATPAAIATVTATAGTIMATPARTAAEAATVVVVATEALRRRRPSSASMA